MNAESQKVQQAVNYCESNESTIKAKNKKVWEIIDNPSQINQLHEALKEITAIFIQYKTVINGINKELLDVDTAIKLDDCDKIFKSAGEYASNFLEGEKEVTKSILSEITEQNAEIRSYIGELVSINFAANFRVYRSQQEEQVTEIKNYTLKQYKYCMYNYPLVGDISKYVYAHELPSNKYNCKGFAKILSKNVVLDEKPRKTLSSIKTSLQNKMKEIQDQKDRLYDYEDRLNRLKGKMEDIESDEETLKYLKQIHKERYLNIYCQHSSPQTPACEICGTSGFAISNGTSCKAGY